MPTNPAYEELIKRLDNFKEIRGRMAYECLVKHLEDAQIVAERDLLANLHDNAEFHTNLLAAHPYACNAIYHYTSEVMRVLSMHTSPGDILMVYNRAALFSILLQIYEEMSAPTPMLLHFEQAEKESLNRFLTLASNQIDELCSFLLSIRDRILGLQLGGARIVLLEMPIGNSLIVSLIHHLLSGHAEVKIIRTSLSRNDSAKEGITRSDLIRESLDKNEIKPNDILLYIDEWITGSNFYNLCQKINDLIPDNVFFLPAALVKSDAKHFERYETFTAYHEKLAKKLGFSGIDFRKVLPPLQTQFIPEGYFFWSEKDRMAGYRKLQLHGSIFSTLDATIKLLQEDEEKLKLALAFTLGAVSGQYELPANPRTSFPVLQKIFRESYEDYLACREEVKGCAEQLARGGEIPDLKTGLSKVIDLYGPILNQRKAKMAMMIAGFYLDNFGPIDPVDRYLIPGHAPALDLLVGRAAITHQSTLEFVKARLNQNT